MAGTSADRRLKIRMADQDLLCSGGVGQAECVKSTGPIAPPARRVLCVVLRLAYYPLPIPGGLLPRHNLRRLSGIFPHVADREPLGLNSLLRLLLSHLECIWFRPTRQANRQSVVFDTTSVGLNLRVVRTLAHFFRRFPASESKSPQRASWASISVFQSQRGH